VIPVFFEVGMIEGFFEGGIFDIAKGLRHGRAVADIAFGVDGDFAVEAGVVVVGFGEVGNIIGKEIFITYLLLLDCGNGLGSKRNM
jgi:hypothetical protein